MLDTKQLKEVGYILSRAKIAMLEQHPFYAHILTHLKFEFVPELPGGSMSATDGKCVYIVPARFLAVSKGEQVSVLAHEQMHCLDGHIWRTGPRDKIWSNIAQDIYIYHVLHSEGFATLVDNQKALTSILHKDARRRPATAIAYDLDDFVGQFWEQIYEAILPQSAAKSKPQSGEGDGQGGEDSPDDGVSGKQHAGCSHCYKPGKQSDDAKEEWKEWIREAGMYAKMAGAKPGRWQELVDAATPTVPFETRFYEFLKHGMGGDQSFAQFNRRFVHRGDYFPTETVEQMGETILVNDTSGSRTTEDLAYAYGVFRAYRELHPCKVHCVDADTECAAWRTFEEWDDLPHKWEAHGRGGTTFDQPFAQAKARNIEPVVLIYMTDGYNYGDFAPKPPYQVLWVLTGDFNKSFAPPYGTIVPVRSTKD